MRLSIINESLNDVKRETLEMLKGKSKDPENDLNLIIKASPFVNKGNFTYIPVVAKWLANGVIRLPEDAERVIETLSKYHKEAKVEPTVKKIDLKTIGSPGDINEILDDVYKTRGVKDLEKDERTLNKFDKYFELLGEENGYKIYLFDKPEQCAHIKDSNWCVKDEKWFNQYKGPFYMVVGPSDEYVAMFDNSSNQLKDAQDRVIKDPKKLGPIKKMIMKHMKIGLEDTEKHVLLDKEEKLDLAKKHIEDLIKANPDKQEEMIAWLKENGYQV
jgi:hypothetical protein